MNASRLVVISAILLVASGCSCGPASSSCGSPCGANATCGLAGACTCNSGFVSGGDFDDVCFADFASLSVNGEALAPASLHVNMRVVEVEPGSTQLDIAVASAAPGLAPFIDGLEQTTARLPFTRPLTAVSVTLGANRRLALLVIERGRYQDVTVVTDGGLLGTAAAPRIFGTIALAAEADVAAASSAVPAGLLGGLVGVPDCSASTVVALQRKPKGWIPSAVHPGSFSDCSGWASLSLSDDGRTLVSAADNGQLRIFAGPNSWTETNIGQLQADVASAVIAGDASRIWVVGVSGELVELGFDAGTWSPNLSVRIAGATSVATSTDGKWVAVGVPASNEVQIFERTGLGLELRERVRRGADAGPGDRFGSSVALSGDGAAMLVSAPQHEPTAAWWFERTDAGYAPRLEVLPPLGFNRTLPAGALSRSLFATPVAISKDGLTGAVGFPYQDAIQLVVREPVGPRAGPPMIFAAEHGIGVPTSLSSFGRRLALSADGGSLAVGSSFRFWLFDTK